MHMDKDYIPLIPDFSPLANKRAVASWWKTLKSKNGFLIMSRKDKRILEEIVATYIDKMREVAR
jgi:hypothetical protein